MTKALVSKDDDDDENGASRSTLETIETVPASSSKSNNETNDKYPPVAVLVGDKFDNPEYFLWDKDKCQMLEWGDTSKSTQVSAQVCEDGWNSILYFSIATIRSYEGAFQALAYIEK